MGRRGKRRKFEGPQARRISAGADSLRPEDLKIKRAPAGLCSVGKGMTDPFAVERFQELFIPMGWTVK